MLEHRGRQRGREDGNNLRRRKHNDWRACVLAELGIQKALCEVLHLTGRVALRIARQSGSALAE